MCYLVFSNDDGSWSVTMSDLRPPPGSVHRISGVFSELYLSLFSLALVNPTSAWQRLRQLLSSQVQFREAFSTPFPLIFFIASTAIRHFFQGVEVRG